MTSRTRSFSTKLRYSCASFTLRLDSVSFVGSLLFWTTRYIYCTRLARCLLTLICRLYFGRRAFLLPLLTMTWKQLLIIRLWSVFNCVGWKCNPITYTLYLLNFFLVFADKDDMSDKVDLVICLGGDKSLLYASSLFVVCIQNWLAIQLILARGGNF